MVLNRVSLLKAHMMHPELRTVSLTKQNPTGTYSTTVDNAIRLPMTKSQISPAGVDEPNMLVYLLPTDSLGTVIPSNGDWITDDTLVSTILNAKRELADAMWRCACVEQ